MRKIGTVATTVVLLGYALFTSLPAAAQAEYPPRSDEVPLPPVERGVGDGLATTGTEITVWMLVTAALVLAGIAALVASRRRGTA